MTSIRIQVFFHLSVLSFLGTRSFPSPTCLLIIIRNWTALGILFSMALSTGRMEMFFYVYFFLQAECFFPKFPHWLPLDHMSKPITAWHNHGLDCSRWIIIHVLGLGPSSLSTLLADTWTRAKEEMPTGPAEAARQGSFYIPLCLCFCLCFSATSSSSVIQWPQVQVIPVSLPAQTLRCPGTTFSGSPWFCYFTPAIS